MLHRMMTHKKLVIGAAAALLASAVQAAPSRIGASTRLQRCGTETCLLVTGRRSDPAASVSLAGHEVRVQGARRWRASLPLDTVRRWSASFARSIAVQVAGPAGGEMRASLPIGLLGQEVDLAFLDVRARH